jgi:hypothetical protein
MMKQEDGLGAYELLDQECRRANFACRVFDDGLGSIGARVGSCEAAGRR